jgi:hypothetical protein
MLEMLMQWYRRRFSDPEAIALLVILVAGFGIIFFFSGLLAPLLVAIVLAYLLEWPTVRLQSIGCSRRWATSIVLVGMNSARELMRQKEDLYKELNLADSSLSEEALIQAMVDNPKLMERPIVVANGKARIGRPPEQVLEIVG